MQLRLRGRYSNLCSQVGKTKCSFWSCIYVFICLDINPFLSPPSSPSHRDTIYKAFRRQLVMWWGQQLQSVSRTAGKPGVSSGPGTCALSTRDAGWKQCSISYTGRSTREWEADASWLTCCVSWMQDCKTSELHYSSKLYVTMLQLHFSKSACGFSLVDVSVIQHVKVRLFKPSLAFLSWNVLLWADIYTPTDMSAIR